jgi:tRNA(adenine34) deaminase
MQMNDTHYIRHCIEAAEASVANGGYPFSALITHPILMAPTVIHGENAAPKCPHGHAELRAIESAVSLFGKDLRACTLFSNFEPCAMCSMLARDFAVGRIVFSVRSPHYGGCSRWPILTESIPAEMTQAGVAQIPEICPDILAEEGRKIFDRLGWRLHLPVTRWGHN